MVDVATALSKCSICNSTSVGKEPLAGTVRGRQWFIWLCNDCWYGILADLVEKAKGCCDSRCACRKISESGGVPSQKPSPQFPPSDAPDSHSPKVFIPFNYPADIPPRMPGMKVETNCENKQIEQIAWLDGAPVYVHYTKARTRSE